MGLTYTQVIINFDVIAFLPEFEKSNIKAKQNIFKSVLFGQIFFILKNHPKYFGWQVLK